MARRYTAPFATCRHLDHIAFERVLGRWFAAQGLAPDEALALDGTTLRGIHGEAIPGVPLVAASAHQTRVVLAQAETVGKGHELAGVQAVLAALPRRLPRRRLSGRVVTGDALLAQRALMPPDRAKRGPSCVVLNRRREGEPAADLGGRRAQFCRSVDAACAGGGGGQ